MAKPKRERNPIIVRNSEIGATDAEYDDAFLFTCFVDNPAYSVVTDLDNNKTLLVGRTGSGKTAILRKIEASNADRCSYISLPDMAISYVTNSDYINFLIQLNIDLELFFVALWKHVICLEYIRSNYNITNTEKSKTLIERLQAMFKRDDRKKKGIEYLRTWESKFWVTMDENIREITRQVEDKVSAEFGADVERLKANVGYVNTMSAVRRQQYEFRAKQIINASLLVELSNVVDVLSTFEEAGGNQRVRYILIDKIDEKWVDDKVKYHLIRALIEALKSLRKIRSLKVVVALRSDVLAKVISDSNNPGLQRDKYDDHIVEISWEKQELFELVDKRIGAMYRRKYTKNDVHFGDVFQSSVAQKKPFEYMVERSLLRPRDIISFTNLSLSAAQGKSEIAARDVKEAEAGYSRTRYEALIQEWAIAFPWLPKAFNFLRHGKTRFAVSDIPGNIAAEFALEIVSSDDLKGTSLYAASKLALEAPGATALSSLANEVLATFYRIGAVGLKLNPNERYRYSYVDEPTVLPAELTKDTKVHVHPMLQRALGIYDDRRVAVPED